MASSMEEAFRKAGATVGKSRLFSDAADAMRKAKAKPAIATAGFVERVWSDDELLAALVRSQMNKGDCAKLAFAYLTTVAADMRGAVSGGGHTVPDTHHRSAPATQNKIGGNADADGEGQCSFGDRSTNALPSATNSETPPCAAGGAHLVADAQRRRGSPSTHPASNGGGAPHSLPDAQREDGRAKFSPGHSRRGVAAMASVQSTVARSLLDTFMVNGRPVGDVTVEEADRWAAGRERDARFVKMLITGLPHGAVIRTHITETDAKRIWSMAQSAPAVTAPTIDARHPADYREVPDV